MKRIYLLLLHFAISLQLSGQDSLLYSIYLLGDAGEPLEAKGRKNLESLKAKLSEENENSILLFLGDNVYPIGIPDASNEEYREAMNKLNELVNLQQDFKGKMIFIPGNHDWAQGKEDGLAHVNRQEDHVTKILGKEAFQPSGGCPGPVMIELDHNIVLLIIDTQWILHRYNKSGKEDGCKFETEQEIYDELLKLIEQNKDKNIVVASHHPMQTYGMHGGTSNFRQHVFPLTDVVHGLYIPIPIIGSIYPLYRKYIGSIQDIAHPKYKEMKKNLENIFSSHMGLIHVAGHEHSLQYSLYRNVHYIVSGSGSKNSPVKKKGNARYAVSETGYSKIAFYSDGRIELELWPTGTESPAVFYLN
jgi:calcineurin-like phosphoesterase family protein